MMPPGVGVLRRLDLHEKVMAAGARRLDGVEYQHAGGHPAAYAPFPAPPAGGPSNALGVRRTTFDAILVDALRGEPTVTLREGERVTALLKDSSNTTTGVPTTTNRISAAVLIDPHALHSPARSRARLPTPPTGNGRYGLGGHWGVDVSHRHAITVTLCEGHEWYEAPVGPDVLLVSVLTRRSSQPITARTYESAARAAIPALRDAELVAGPLGAAEFQQRARSVAQRSVFLVGDAAGYDDPTTGEGLALGMLLAERLAAHLGDLLAGRCSGAEAAHRYRVDHIGLVRERRRLTQLALFLARHPTLSGRALARAAADPTTLSKLLAINCGYQTFADLSARDWLSLVGI